MKKHAVRTFECHSFFIFLFYDFYLQSQTFFKTLVLHYFLHLIFLNSSRRRVSVGIQNTTFEMAGRHSYRQGRTELTRIGRWRGGVAAGCVAVAAGRVGCPCVAPHHALHLLVQPHLVIALRRWRRLHTPLKSTCCRFKNHNLKISQARVRPCI